jgi:hypothetical protein
MRTNRIGIVAATLVVALAGLLLACSQPPSLSGSGDKAQPKEPAGMTSISPVEPKGAAPIARYEAFPNLEMVASQGDCAPRYANGHMGTCINARPCRGVGMRAATGATECRCWAKAGGCGEAERCDGLTKACVPEKTPDGGRSEVE